MKMENILLAGAERLELTLTETAVARFRVYLNCLEDRNRVMNLTAITGEEEITKRHFLDSLALLRRTEFKEKRVIDVGSGAGFPGLPLKIVEPTVNLTLLDAQQKRIAFLREVCANMEFDGVSFLHARGEEEAHRPASRARYDIVVSRAMARLNVLCEICLPFVQAGGVFLAMKSVNTEEEISEAGNAIAILGGKIEEIADYAIPFSDLTHRAVVIRKIQETPKGFPRRHAKIQKKPIL